MSRTFKLFGKIFVRVAQNSFRICFFVLATGACIVLIPAPRIVSQAAGGSLQQAVDTIRQILAKEGSYTRATTSARNNYKSSMEKKYLLSEAKGCQLVVESDSHVHSELPEQSRVSDRRSTEIFRPDFSALDPASVFVGDPQPPQQTWTATGYLVRISVEVGKPPMVASSVDKEKNAAHDLPGLPTLAVYVSSREAADRLAKAFEQVATACHAKPPSK